MRLNILLIILVSSLADLSAQPTAKVAGTWEGTLNVGTDLRIVFHISEAGPGRLRATADSPDQGAFGIPCDSAYFESGILTIEMRSLNAGYSGKLVNDSTIEGHFTQGMEFPLDLRRSGKAEAKEETKKEPQIMPDVPYRTEEVSVKGEGVLLSGTLFALPGPKDSPVVLIIAGSGPTDRNGNSILIPGENNSLLQLAEKLGDGGISSLRYDKRGVGRSRMTEGVTEESITITQIVDDARAFFEYLEKRGYSRIYLAGHSEGSLIAMLLAGQVKSAGVISIAGTGRKAVDILHEQLTNQLPAGVVRRFDSAADSIAAGHTVKEVPPALATLLRPSVQPYLNSWFKQDPKKLIGTLDCPILILQGTKDTQIGEKDARLLHEGNPRAKMVLIRDMNHVLKIISSFDPAENRKSYSDPRLEISEQLVEEIVTFIGR
jgi:pimeloyl-ACP methyl ester carboxylesterase